MSNQVKNKMPKEEKTAREASKQWGFLLNHPAAIAAIATATLYLQGYIYYQIYLNTWNIKPGVFPISYKEVLIYGFYSVYAGLSLATQAIAKIPVRECLIGLSILTTIVYLTVKLTPILCRIPGTRNKTEGKEKHKWQNELGDALKSIFTAGMIFIALPISVLALALALSIPVLIADRTGKMIAENQKNRFNKGCSTNIGTDDKCTKLITGDQKILTGYIIVESTDNVAIYDPKEHITTTLHRSSIKTESTILK